ncbi:hypothetical protein Taro_047117, partial [Colocasia esculenta]|nr:hypothetical protein [Colocasia esculenta]
MGVPIAFQVATTGLVASAEPGWVHNGGGRTVTTWAVAFMMRQSDPRVWGDEFSKSSLLQASFFLLPRSQPLLLVLQYSSNEMGLGRHELE